MSDDKKRLRVLREAKANAKALAQVEGAIDILRKKVWVRGGPMEGENGVCAQIALNIASGYRNDDGNHCTHAEHLILREANRVHKPRLNYKYICITEWNDNEARTKREILGVFHRVAKRLREMVPHWTPS